MSLSPPSIRKPRNEAETAAVKALFEEYAATLGVSLCFQGFDAEMATFPAKYAPPGGALLLASVDGEPAGAVGLCRLAPDVCEMKRLYVRPRWRGHALGQRLVEGILAEGRALGYATMRLDTLASMMAAQALYRAAGFVETPAYYDNPLPGTIYMALDLR